MRELRLLKQDTDAGNLILGAPDSDERFVLHVDEVLRAAVRGESAKVEPAAAPPRPVDASPLPVSPRDIQVRVRAGESPQAVADDYGIEVDRVLRFAGPVVEERSRIAQEARRARARRNDTQTLIFGETVDLRYEAYGITPSAVAWDSYRREDGEWVVTATWEGGEGEHRAQWIFHRTSRMVTPLDDTAGDLLSDRPIHRVTKPAQATRPALSVAPPLAPGVVAFPPMPDARTGPLPVVDDVFDQESTLDEPRRIAPLTSVPAHAPVAAPPVVPVPPAAPPAPGAPSSPSAPSSPAAAASVPSVPSAPRVAPVAASTIEDEELADELMLEFEEPPLPLGIIEPVRAAQVTPARVTNLGVSRRDESDDDRAARARIPSWDDILLGVRPKGD